MDTAKAKKKQKFYAIRRGLQCNVILTSWDEAKLLVLGFPSAEFKSFFTLKNAEDYLAGKPTDQQLESIGKEVKGWPTWKRDTYKKVLQD